MSLLRREFKLTRKRTLPFLFLAPALSLYGFFMFGAIIIAIALSFLHWEGLGGTIEFVGLQNYFYVITDSRFWLSVKNTLVYLIVYNIIMILLAMGLALLSNSPLLKLKTFFRSIYFLPVTFSFVAIALTFSMIYHIDYGIINLILKALNLPKVGWLQDPNIALYSLAFMRVWRNTGYYMIILLAGLQSIPDDLYDAAKVDGANAIQRTLYITFPLWKGMILVALVMSTIWSFQLFAEPWILLKGGPADATLTNAIYIYQQAFGALRFDIASAAAVINAVLVFIISSLQFKLIRGGA